MKRNNIKSIPLNSLFPNHSLLFQRDGEGEVYKNGVYRDTNKNILLILYWLVFAGMFFACGDNKSNEQTKNEKKNDSIPVIKETKKEAKKKKEAPCDFDTRAQTDDFLKDKPQFAGYKWNNKTKEAILLIDSKDSLTIHRGGCHYYEFSITLKTLSITNEITDSAFWFDKALSYAKDLFDKSDYDFIRKNIEAHEYDVSKTEDVILYSFPHEKYDELYIRLSNENKAKGLEIAYSYSLTSE